MAPCEQRRHVLLISHPRSASNLLVKMLNLDDQPAVVQGAAKRGYHFFPAACLAINEGFMDRPLDQWSDERKDRMRTTMREGFDTLEQTRIAAEESGTIAFTKEHSALLLDPQVASGYIFGEKGALSPEVAERGQWRVDELDDSTGERVFSPNNLTILSDAYLRQWRLVFIIRHPAMAAPSLARVIYEPMWQLKPSKDQEESTIGSRIRFFWNSNNLIWARKLYDLARDIGQSPIVIDADDIISDPTGATVRKFAENLGLDPARVKTEWDPMSEEEYRDKIPQAQRMLATLAASTGLRQDKLASDVDIVAEAEKWREEFGEERGRELEGHVWDTLPHYEYLRERRLRA